MATSQVYTVRCYVEHKHGVWQAFSVEFGLAAQGESLADAKRRLERMIQSYLYDALVGQDKPHRKELLARKAALSQRLKYRFYSSLAKIGGMSKAFKERIPTPSGPIAADC